ncbi:hypothetical protein [Cupriavidus consociatus]|uniref:hypothetical protein n=1 Tax=Cupriavidus consociatus TaxID=2821357 RepID=UPI003D703588
MQRRVRDLTLEAELSMHGYGYGARQGGRVALDYDLDDPLAHRRLGRDALDRHAAAGTAQRRLCQQRAGLRTLARQRGRRVDADGGAIALQRWQ